MGDINLVRALALAGVDSAAVVEPGNPARYSRSTVAVLDKIDPATDPEGAVEQLLSFAAARKQRPVLFYDGDWDLLLVSRYRRRLHQGFDFIIPDAELVEDLVDKARYQDLAARLDIPVPRALRLASRDDFPNDLGFPFPVVVKPLTRHHGTWRRFAQTKAKHIEDERELRELHAQLAGSDLAVLVQEVVPGPEDRVLSYHCYVDATGEIAGEFTDRKLRTYPKVYGYSTAIEITNCADVREIGVELTHLLGLRSAVAKFDFKRAPDGRLILLEVNPRFNLVHHPGALAGVNLPALVYADLVGLPRPAASLRRSGVTWCNPAHDRQAAAAWHIPWLRWLKMVATSDAYSGFAWNDPYPLLGAATWRVRQRLRKPAAPAVSVPASPMGSDSA
jgi:predicted ATP-grasp superfamily ATP-dependent carboligase